MKPHLNIGVIGLSDSCLRHSITTALVSMDQPATLVDINREDYKININNEVYLKQYDYLIDAGERNGTIPKDNLKDITFLELLPDPTQDYFCSKKIRGKHNGRKNGGAFGKCKNK